jgi:hypothetical protein
MATNVPSLPVPRVELVGLDGLLSWQIFTWCEISGTWRCGVMANIHMIFIAWGGDVWVYMKSHYCREIVSSTITWEMKLVTAVGWGCFNKDVVHGLWDYLWELGSRNQSQVELDGWVDSKRKMGSLGSLENGWGVDAYCHVGAFI